MAVASTAGLVPITRSFLAKYYDKYPFKPINGDLAGVEESLRKETELIDAERRKSQVLDSAEVDLTQHFIACFSFIDEARKSSRGVLGIALPADLEGLILMPF